MKLHVEGTHLKNASGEIVRLKGVSTHGLQMYPEYITKEAFQTLRDDWKANVIRLAMYTQEGGFLDGSDREELYSLIDKGVKFTEDLGMYCIIDWHILSDGQPLVNKEEAKMFFERVSKTYASCNHVLYEICNEPNGADVTWADVKAYADEVIPVIRTNDTSNVILVGTTTWSQDVEECAKNPVANPKNVMYVCHFYAASHKDDKRAKVVKALADGTPVFVSEFSICDASGNGALDYEQANKWMQLLDENHISFVGWNLSNKDESSALLLPDCKKLSGWEEKDLNESGKWLRNTLRNR